jgi:hypothetical protein
MPHEAPNAMPTQISSLSTMQLKLRIGQNFQGESGAEKSHAKGTDNIQRVFTKGKSCITHSEWNCEWQGDNTQYKSLRYEDFQKGAFPKAGLFLDSIVPRVIFAANQ